MIILKKDNQIITGTQSNFNDSNHQFITTNYLKDFIHSETSQNNYTFNKIVSINKETPNDSKIGKNIPVNSKHLFAFLNQFLKN